ncbi:CPBP family intramembrane glutamic endopeptidase [Vallitalea okinawensis]|uniref:CPBP family intramembrane glutamic endopeptidase n=1 Tax=Vallitalea okinawensis TaxID=2078660 RepID=UPI001300292F|nr:CPBP family intramembrane glutamic endopeptidase [Vallitalea okinawensis]
MNDIKPIKFLSCFLLFFIFGIMFTFYNYLLIPLIIEELEISPFIVTQTVFTVLLNVPIFLTTLILVKSEGNELSWENIKVRLNFRKPVLNDFLWMLGSLIVAIVITVLIILLLSVLPISFDLLDLEKISPIIIKPLKGFERLFVLFMPISFFFNYVGEEILWRGYIYPRQELIYGKKTWIISGLLHGVYHFFMGVSVLVFLPILLAIPFVYSKTKNIYIVIIMHALLGAPTDFLLAIGI